MKEESEKALQSPEQIADHLRVTYVPTYLLATAIGLLLAAFIVWGVLGSVSDKAYYSGVVFPVQGTIDITLPNKGIVRSMLVHNGDSIQQGQTIAMVSVGEGHSYLTSTVSGLVISTKVDNEPFEAFDPIVSVVDSKETQDSKRTQLIAYADNEAQRNLRIGMEAQVWPANEKRDEIGYVRGRISQVVRYPADADDVRQTLKSDIMAQRLLGDGQDVLYEVRIDLLTSPADSTCYDWSFGQPEDVSMRIGTYCSVLTETRRRSMFQYLFETSRTHIRNLQQKFE
jgi:multidrug efflux pump subunit AcrA (membrane-fusion protein)